MRRELTREMSVFFGQNKRAVVVYRKNKITPLFFFLYRDTHSIPDAVIEKYVIRV